MEPQHGHVHGHCRDCLLTTHPKDVLWELLLGRVRFAWHLSVPHAEMQRDQGRRPMHGKLRVANQCLPTDMRRCSDCYALCDSPKEHLHGTLYLGHEYDASSLSGIVSNVFVTRAQCLRRNLRMD